MQPAAALFLLVHSVLIPKTILLLLLNPVPGLFPKPSRLPAGEDFDQRVMEYFIKLIKKKYKTDISKDARALQKLRREAERAKRALSSQHQVRVCVWGGRSRRSSCSCGSREGVEGFSGVQERLLVLRVGLHGQPQAPTQSARNDRPPRFHPFSHTHTHTPRAVLSLLFPPVGPYGGRVPG